MFHLQLSTVEEQEGQGRPLVLSPGRMYGRGQHGRNGKAQAYQGYQARDGWNIQLLQEGYKFGLCCSGLKMDDSHCVQVKKIYFFFSRSCFTALFCMTQPSATSYTLQTRALVTGKYPKVHIQNYIADPMILYYFTFKIELKISIIGFFIINFGFKIPNLWLGIDSHI